MSGLGGTGLASGQYYLNYDSSKLQYESYNVGTVTSISSDIENYSGGIIGTSFGKLILTLPVSDT